MKYLKPLRVNENKVNDIINNLNDICLELKDIGLSVIITHNEKFDSYNLSIEESEYKYYNRITYKDKNASIETYTINMVIEQFISYMESIGYSDIKRGIINQTGFNLKYWEFKKGK